MERDKEVIKVSAFSIYGTPQNIQDKYKCSSCEYENSDYTCNHPEFGSEKFGLMSIRECWKPFNKRRFKGEAK